MADSQAAWTMLEIDQEMISSAMAAVRKGMPSCMWSAAADRIVAERAKREAHLRNRPTRSTASSWLGW